MHSSDSREVDNVCRRRLRFVLAEICRQPKRFLLDTWNWKAAALSVLFRAPVFLISTQRHGLETMATAGIVESIFRIAITGIDASITQAVQRAEPQWAVAIVVLAAIPGMTVALQAVVHLLAATPNLRAGLVASLILSVLSSGFNWYSMRKGALLVGRKGDSFATDLGRMPMLIGRFVLGPVLILWRGVKVIFSRGTARTPAVLGEKTAMSSHNQA
jgi:hypothetical protein